MKKYFISLLVILIIGLVGCTPKTELEYNENINNNVNINNTKELNKFTLEELFKQNDIKEFSKQLNEETKSIKINHEYGSYALKTIKLNDSTYNLNLVIGESEYEDAEVRLILVNEKGEEQEIFKEMYAIFCDYLYNDIEIEFVEFGDYLIFYHEDIVYEYVYMDIYNDKLVQVISEYVIDGFKITEDKIKYSKYEYYTAEELNQYNIPEPYNIYIQDFEIVEENNLLKNNKIRDNFENYSFTAQVP